MRTRGVLVGSWWGVDWRSLCLQDSGNTQNKARDKRKWRNLVGRRVPELEWQSTLAQESPLMYSTWLCGVHNNDSGRGVLVSECGFHTVITRSGGRRCHPLSTSLVSWLTTGLRAGRPCLSSAATIRWDAHCWGLAWEMPCLLNEHLLCVGPGKPLEQGAYGPLQIASEEVRETAVG